MVAWIVRLNLPVAASDFFFCEMTRQAAARLPAFRVADFTNGTAQRAAARGVDATPQPPLPAGEEKARTRQCHRLRCELRDPTRRDRRELRKIHRMIGACAPKPRGKMPFGQGLVIPYDRSELCRLLIRALSNGFHVQTTGQGWVV